MSSSAQMRFVGSPAYRQTFDWQLELLRWSFFVLLITGPLCFGATEPWSLLLIEVGSTTVFLFWIGLRWAAIGIELDMPIAACLLFGLLIAAQLFTGRTVYRYATQQALLQISSYFVCFLLARHLLESHEARSKLAALLTGFGGVVALFAIVQASQGNGKIYWIRATSTQSFFGPYANKNHYAGLLEMLLPFALHGATRSGIPNFKRAVSVFSAVLMAASVARSGSRTGILVVSFELVVFLGIRLISLHRLQKQIVPIILFVFCTAFMIWIAGDVLANQTALLHDPIADASLVNRSQIARDSFELVKQRPIFGWGLGTFPVVYPQVASWYSDVLVNAAHDDYLQLLVEAGISGLGLAFVFLCGVFRVGMKRLHRLPNSSVGAALLGCTGLLLHSFTDFNLHVPANAAIFFSLCGMICVAEGETKPRASSLRLRAEIVHPACDCPKPLHGRETKQPAAAPTIRRFQSPTT